MADYSFTNAPAPEDSIKFKLVRWLTGDTPTGQVPDGGQLWLSPNITDSASRAQLAQNNHLIPNEVRDDDDFKPFFEDIADPTKGESFYDQADFKTNGAPMPASAADSLRMGVAVHYLQHPEYTGFVKARVQEIVDAYNISKETNPALAREEAIKALHGLQSFLKFAVTAGSGPDGRPLLLLNKEDPHLNPGETLADHNKFAIDNVDIEAIKSGNLENGASLYGDRPNYYTAGYNGQPIKGDIFDLYDEVTVNGTTKLVADPFANWSDEQRAEAMVRAFIVDSANGDLRKARELIESQKAKSLIAKFTAELSDQLNYQDGAAKPTNMGMHFQHVADQVRFTSGEAAATAYVKEALEDLGDLGDQFRRGLNAFLGDETGSVSVDLIAKTTFTMGTLAAASAFLSVQYAAETVDNPISFEEWAAQKTPDILAALPGAAVSAVTALGVFALLVKKGGYAGMAFAGVIAGAGLYEAFEKFVDYYLEATKFQEDDETRQKFIEIKKIFNWIENNTWIPGIVDFINSFVGGAVGAVAGAVTEPPQMYSAARDQVLQLLEEQGEAWLIGLDAAKIIGNSSNNVLFQYNYGEAQGGEGDDTCSIPDDHISPRRS
ncbi:MAG: AHH domain-containing protein, partial [Paracoccaceae bacterium]